MTYRNKSNKLVQIEYRLSVWARWYSQVITGELGYSNLPIDEIMKTGGWIRQTRRREIHVNEMAERMDAALQQLRQDNLELAKALYAFYILPGLLRDKARQLGLSHSCFKRRVEMAKTWLVAWFSAKGEL